MSLMRTLGRVGVGVVSVVRLSMERMPRKQMRKIGLATLALALLAPLGADAQEAEVSANAGWVSQYFYRGILQKTSSASAGLDLGYGALSLGTWLADVGDGVEVDFFGSVGADVGEVSLSVGGTAYLYTGEFDDTYLEANLGAGYGPLSVEFRSASMIRRSLTTMSGSLKTSRIIGSSASRRSTRDSMARSGPSDLTSMEPMGRSGTASRRRSSISRSRGS